MAKLVTDAPLESSIPLSDFPQGNPPNLILDGFLRREELAQQLGCSPRTIDRWQALRRGPPRVCVGRTILYSVESVREWLRSREQCAPTTNKSDTPARKKNVHRHLP
jgi:predicted DNA-binding transcriptional regulator AlpA